MKSLFAVLLPCCYLCLTLLPPPAAAGDDQYLHFVGNVVRVVGFYDSSNNLVRKELWLASTTPTGLKVFQFRCTPTETGCDRDQFEVDMLSGCTVQGVGTGDGDLTSSGFACAPGSYGRCREITGQADRRASDGAIIFNLSLNLSVFGCAAK